MSERIQKLLAQSGFGSRREIEGWIRAGRITVNGQLAKLGDVASEEDKLTLDGRVVHLKKRETVTTRVLAYHKPVGQVCTRSDPEGRPTVFNSLPRLSGERWIAVGRLDLNTSGLILMTNNGELANRLMHPSSGMDREYAVRILGEVDNDMLQRLRDGVMLEDGKGRFEDIVDSGGEGANHWYHVVLKEGRNREVRRLWESQGVRVSRLQRVRFGPIILPRKIRPAKFQELEEGDLTVLMEEVGLKYQRPVLVKKGNQRVTRISKPKPKPSRKRF